MKYSENFERDWNWYVKYKDVFTFDGRDRYTNKKGEDLVVFDENGKTAKECFYLWDSNGKIEPCKEPELYKQILKCKGSVNFNIKMWAEDRAKGYLPKVVFSKECRDEQEKWFRERELEYDWQQTIEEEFELLPWMVEAVENQKLKYY